MATLDGSRPTDTALRWIAAVGTFVSAVVHGYLYWAQGWSTVPVTGLLFAVNAVTGAVIAIALTASAHWAWRALAIGFNGASLLALLLAHTDSGFFGTRELLLDSWQVMALVAEGVALVAAALALLAWWRRRSGGQTPRERR